MSRSNWEHYFLVLFARRKFIIVNTLAVVILTAAISLLWPPKYSAKAVIMPPKEESFSSLGLMLGMGGRSGGLLSSIGKSGLPGTTTLTDIYMVVLKSGTIISRVIDRCDLIRYYKLEKQFRKDPEKAGIAASKILLANIKVSATPEGFITVQAQSHHPEMSARIANSFFESLDDFNQTTYMTAGRKMREFIDKRLADENRSSLQAAETLRVFQERNRTVSLTDEMKASIEMAAKLETEIMKQRIQLDVLRSYSTGDNPEVKRMANDIQQAEQRLRRMVSGDRNSSLFVPFQQAPKVALELARRIRDVKVHEEVYALLMQQYEQARIMEARDTPTIEFLERAAPSKQRASPKRKLWVIAAFLLSLGTGCLWILLQERWAQFKQENQRHYSMLAEIWQALGDDLRRLSKRNAPS